MDQCLDKSSKLINTLDDEKLQKLLVITYKLGFQAGYKQGMLLHPNNWKDGLTIKKEDEVQPYEEFKKRYE